MATINPGDSIYRGIEWESKDTSKAVVEGNGKECIIRGVEAGKAVIRCKIKNYDNTETIGEYEIEVLDYNVKTVTISGTSSVEPGQTVTLMATMDTDNSEYSKIEWSSSDEAKATVSGNDKTCIVTGKVSGSVTITCKVTNLDGTIINGTYTVTILDINVKSITIGGATTVDKGSNIALTATLSPTNAKYTKIEWSSSNTGIATVLGNNKTCTVTGVGAGGVTITCKVTNSDNTTISKTCNIVIKATLASVAKVGDFVNYDAGNWTSTVVSSSDSDHGAFGNYTAGSSKNACVNPYQSTNIYSGGWRVFSIIGTTVNLIHAGTPAIYCHAFAGDSNVSNSKLNSFCNNNFVNSTFATSARSMNYGDRNSSLINCGCLYFLADYYENTVQYYVKQNGSINKGWAGRLGFRPIVVLKNGVKTSGLANNGYNQTGWVLTN